MSEGCDILISGGTVIDGSGDAGRRADVAGTGDRITALGELSRIQIGRASGWERG